MELLHSVFVCNSTKHGIQLKMKRSLSIGSESEQNEENSMMKGSTDHRTTPSSPVTHPVAKENNRIFVSFFAGVGSSALASVFCAPLDLVRTRLQVLGEVAASRAQPSKSLFNTFQDIVRVDGFRGCFRGLGATFVYIYAVLVRFIDFRFILLLYIFLFRGYTVHCTNLLGNVLFTLRNGKA